MKGFLVGIGLGVAAGLLFAPKPGKQTRRELRERIDESVETGRRKFGQVLDQGRGKAGEIGRKVGEQGFDKLTEDVRPEVGQRRA